MEYKNINDYEVLYLIEENQSELKELMFNKYKPILSKISYNYLFKLKDYGVEYDDIYQEALLGLNYAIDHFDNYKDNKFYTYALICVNSKLRSFSDRMRSNRNKILNESMTLSNGELFDLENIGSIGFQEDYVYFYNKVLSFKNSLSDEHAQVFELKYNGFSNGDIGVLLGLSVKKVYYDVCYIRNRLNISGL